jgi:phospholipase/carboxylesterase
MRSPLALRRTIGPLDAITYKGDADGPTLVLFHGYGAEPLTLRIDGIPSGRAWFPIDVEALQKSQMAGKALNWSAHEPHGMPEGRAAALEFLKELGVPWGKLILGGFSQGAILAVDLALRAPEAPLGLAILSGNLVNADEWRRLAADRKGLPFLQSHGLADPILGYQGALRLSELLKTAGLKGDLISFEGGHGIPVSVIEKLAQFIQSL